MNYKHVLEAKNNAKNISRSYKDAGSYVKAAEKIIIFTR
jgi:hypothetical protein